MGHMMLINNCKSDFEKGTCGVPQGSILEPLLILLFINDLHLFVNNVSADVYANDTTLYDIQTSLEAIKVNLQERLNQLHIWCKNNGMILNSVRTKVMLVTTNQKRLRLKNTNLNLLYMDEKLKMISSD